MTSHLQIRLITKQPDYAIPDTTLTVPDTVTTKELNQLVNSLLISKETGENTSEEFDFLLLGELIRSPLTEHLELKNIVTDQVHEIEYFVKYPAPSPEISLTHNDWVSSVNAIDKWILSGCYDATVQIWGTDGSHKLTIPGHTAPVKAVAWLKCDVTKSFIQTEFSLHFSTQEDNESTFISTSHDETAILWQWNQQTNAVDCIHVCKGHARSVDCVAVCQATNRFATGSYDQMLKIWSADNETENAGGDEDKKRFKADNLKTKIKTPLRTLSGHTDGISGVQWIDTSEVATCGLDCTLRIWDVELGGLKHQLNGSKAFLSISYSPITKLIVSGSSDRHVRLWDPRVKDGSLVKSVYSSHDLWITSVAWSPVDEYQFVSGSMDFMVKLWDTRSCKTPLFDISGHEDKVFAVDWSLKDYIISGGADNHIKLYKFQEKSQSEGMES
ncbi:ribosome biogenesis protein WDR12 homolog [Caerostris darwini]|uniref:Ribosome biogenesis protein WDR12 homolog n=1 Tax=Caerostris darwini TaxID=1538125 RepID=A0AAV4V3P3_9ARAC|nr:ribosome biogenesis protein WDR12 homolog [Caerostris darwini]